MDRTSDTTAIPDDAEARRAIPPVPVYRVDDLPAFDAPWHAAAREGARSIEKVVVPPRDARCIRVPAGHWLRIACVEGPQVGDLNLWNARDHDERFFSGKTRALHGTHVSIGDHLWSTLPHLRPLATITADTLSWYGTDAFGGRVHDVIGTRCDPYTNAVLGRPDYHHCCHSNLMRAFAEATDSEIAIAERAVHDVLNVFMCTGSDASGRYFMKASPVRAGDHLELFAQVDLLAALSTCPGGDCSADHSSDAAPCYPLSMEVFAPRAGALDGWSPPTRAPYGGSHGLGD